MDSVYQASRAASGMLTAPFLLPGPLRVKYAGSNSAFRQWPSAPVLIASWIIETGRPLNSAADWTVKAWPFFGSEFFLLIRQASFVKNQPWIGFVGGQNASGLSCRLAWRLSKFRGFASVLLSRLKPLEFAPSPLKKSILYRLRHLHLSCYPACLNIPFGGKKMKTWLQALASVCQSMNHDDALGAFGFYDPGTLARLYERINHVKKKIRRT